MCHTNRVRPHLARPHLATLIDDFRHYGRERAVVSHTGNRSVPSTYDEIAELSARFAAEYARRGILPGRKLGRTWRFLRPELEQAIKGLPQPPHR